MTDQNNLTMDVASMATLDLERDQRDSINTQEENENEDVANIEIPGKSRKEILTEAINKLEEESKIVAMGTSLDSEGILKKKKQIVKLNENFQLNITEIEIEDKTAMTDKPEKRDQQEMTDGTEHAPLNKKTDSERSLTPIKLSLRPLTQSLRRFKKRSSSVDCIEDMERKVKSSPSQPIPTSEVEEVVTELEDEEGTDREAKRRSSSNLTRTVSRVSSRMSRMSRTVRQLICCGITMEVPSEDKIQGREGHAI